MPRKLKLRQRGRVVANNNNNNNNSSNTNSRSSVAAQSDEALFFVDKSAARPPATRAAKGKRKRGDDDDDVALPLSDDNNAPPVRSVHLARERVLGIDAALAANAKAAALFLSKPNTTPRAVESSTQILVKRIRKGSNGADPVERAAQGFAAHVAVQRKTNLAAAGTYDLWSDSKAPAAVISAVSKKKRMGLVAPSETAKARALKTVPAVLPPLNAESVNPTMDDYLDFAAATVVSYERDEHDRIKNNQLINATRGRKVAAIEEVLEQDAGDDVDVAPPRSKKKPVSDDNDDDNDLFAVNGDFSDDDDADDSEELSRETKAALAKAHATKPPKNYMRPSVRDRLHRAHNEGHVEALRALEVEQIDRLDEIAEELVAEKDRGAANSARARAATLAHAAGAAGVGRNKFHEPDPHVVLPKRIVRNQGRLVRVAATPYSARDALASLQRRGKAEVGSKAVRNYARTTYNVK